MVLMPHVRFIVHIGITTISNAKKNLDKKLAFLLGYGILRVKSFIIICFIIKINHYG